MSALLSHAKAFRALAANLNRQTADLPPTSAQFDFVARLGAAFLGAADDLETLAKAEASGEDGRKS